MVNIGIIGGTGLEDPRLLKDPRDVTVRTPYGDPSSELKKGIINGVDVTILSRHGEDHRIPPSQVNNRANIWALKEQGCTHILSTTACGSLREEIGRGHFVIPDQFIDFTRHREVTFFEEFSGGDLKHVPMADPFDANLREKLIRMAKKMSLPCHEKGTIVTIEGPRFSTRAESNMFRILGADVINMSTAPEAILANELGLRYAVIAISTDYDCWRTDETPVTWEEVLKVFKLNVKRVKELLVAVLSEIR
jgi:5'-methylthioadenosine phosphorylase